MTAPTKAAAPVHLDDDLKALCLPTIASSWERMAEEARRERRTHAEYLADLASLEVGGRRERKIERRIAEARFPILKTLDAFDFAGQAGLDKETVLELSARRVRGGRRATSCCSGRWARARPTSRSRSGSPAASRSIGCGSRRRRS